MAGQFLPLDQRGVRIGRAGFMRAIEIAASRKLGFAPAKQVQDALAGESSYVISAAPIRSDNVTLAQTRCAAGC